MNTNSVSTRRRFFWKAGAVLSVPLAAGVTEAQAAHADAGMALAARVAELDDIDAIRELHRAFLRHVNAGESAKAAQLFADPRHADIDPAISRISADSFGERDSIELVPGSVAAMAAMHCTVQSEIAIDTGGTLVEMARLQGEGVVRRTARCILDTACVKQAGAWKFERLSYRDA